MSPHQSPKAKVARLLAKQYGVVTREQARAVGIGDDAIKRLIASGLWVKKYPGVLRDVAVPVSWHQELKAVTLRKLGRVWISHRAAAAFWALDGFDTQVIEATTDSEIRRIGPGVTIHRVPMMPPTDVTAVRGIPLTTVWRTLMDVGLVADTDSVELALECALRRGIASIPRLTRRLGSYEGRGRKGPNVLRKVLQQRGTDTPATESIMETRFLQFLRRYKLSLPDRQVRIHDSGGFMARVDFYFSEPRVVVEVESRRHHSSRADWERDLHRRNVMTVQGLRVLHVTHRRMTHDSDRLASELRRLLRGPA